MFRLWRQVNGGASDITYIRTGDNWSYVATAICIDTRQVLACVTADHMRTEIVTDVLAQALAVRGFPAGVVFHSDRGSQYTSNVYSAFCGAQNVRISHSAVGDCWDNAVSESFFATLKRELVDGRVFDSVDCLALEVDRWVVRYNSVRLHSALGYDTPDQRREALLVSQLAS